MTGGELESYSINFLQLIYNGIMVCMEFFQWNPKLNYGRQNSDKEEVIEQATKKKVEDIPVPPTSSAVAPITLEDVVKSATPDDLKDKVTKYITGITQEFPNTGSFLTSINITQYILTGKHLRFMAHYFVVLSIVTSIFTVKIDGTTLYIIRGKII